MAKSQEFIQGELDELIKHATTATTPAVQEFAGIMLAQLDIANRERTRTKLLKALPDINVEELDQAIQAELKVRPFSGYSPGDGTGTASLSVGGLAEVPSPSPPVWTPFPVGLLPDATAEFVKVSSTAIQCDPAMIALPLLTVAGGSIGNRRRTRLRDSWTEPPCLWGLIVSESGSRKTPALKEVTRSVRRAEHEVIDVYRRDTDQHKSDLDSWKLLPTAQRRKTEKPEPPSPPKRLLVSDTTVEALIPILQANESGLLLFKDELSGLFSAFDQYKGGRGSDSQQFLEMWSGGTIINDRKGDAPQSVRNAVVSICGGIQPSVLAKAIRPHVENGMSARFLLAMPPDRAAKWDSKNDISLRVRAGWAKTLEQLSELELGPDGLPVLLSLTPEAEASWALFHNEYEEYKQNASGAYRYALAKLQAYCARLALVCALLEDHNAAGIDLYAIERAIGLTDWFRREARRVYTIINENSGERMLRELTQWLALQDGPVTLRDVTRGLRAYRGAEGSERARAHLEELLGAGAIYKQERRPGSPGGQPTWEFGVTPDQEEVEL